MENIEISLATESDAKAIATFQQNMALETEKKELDFEIVFPAVSAVFNDPQKGFYLVARDGEKTVASLLITYEWSDWRNSTIWYIQSVYVLKDYRGKGIYKRMYQRIVEDAKQNGVRFVRLYVETDNQPAQGVYESLGMKRLPYFMYQTDLEKDPG